MPRSHAKKVTRNKDEKIQLIYQTFFDLIRKQGYSKVSTNHIAAAAQVSVGTIYRYFPHGKASIISQYFDATQEDIFNVEEFFQADRESMEEAFKRFATQFVLVHRQNLLYHRAYEQAMLENQEVFKNYTQKVHALLDSMALRLHQASPVPEEMTVERAKAGLWVIYNVVEALTRQHLVVMPLFATDEEFAEFLAKLLVHFSENPAR